MIRADRDEIKSRKSVGGGLCIFVDNRWATHFRIHEKVCTTDYELLSVSFRAFYLPREFGNFGNLEYTVRLWPVPHWGSPIIILHTFATQMLSQA